MKLNLRLITIFLSFFAGVISLEAQGWKHIYPSSATLFRSIQTPDGGAISCGINDESQLIVIKTDLDGAVMVSRTFKGVNKVSKVLLAKAADGNYVIALNDSSTAIKWIKISPNADSLSLKRIPINVALQEFQALSQGNFGILGANSNQKATFLKLNTLGDTLWTKQYVNSENMLSGFVEDNDGSILWQLNDKVQERPVLWILNAAGQELNLINLNSNINTFFRLIRLKDGNLVACTSRDVIKFRTDGRLIWAIMPKFSRGSKDISNILATQDGGLVVLGYGVNPVLNETELLKLDSEGKVKWSERMTEDLESKPGTDFSLFLLFGLQECADKGFLLSGRVENSSIGINKKSGLLIKTNSEGLVYANVLRGQLITDLNKNCRADNNEKGIQGWVIKADGGGSKVFNTTSDANGHYSFQLDSGSYKLSVFAPNNLWEACFKDSIIKIGIINKSDTFNIPVKPVLTCTGLRVDIGTPILRRCFNNTYNVRYCNNGTMPVQNAYVEVTLDTTLIYQSATLPLISKNGRTYRFNVGDLDILQCGFFNIVVKASCETPSVTGRTACTLAHIFPDSICPSWRGAKMEVTGRCDNDSLRFSLRNAGQQPTTTPINYTIIVDEVVFLRSNQTFNAGQSRTFLFKPNGRTYRLQAEQERGYPTNQLLAVSVEGCGQNAIGGVSTGFVLQYPEADEDPFIDMDCQTIVSSLETNIKMASPIGYRNEHLIEPNTDIEYMIRFQNVGTDTAFNIIIRDTLSALLEPSSIEFGASSHPYTAELIGSNVLKFTFRDIRLADSVVNMAASQGFVKFRVHQKPNLSLGSNILNKAAIYFDYNEAIITSRISHTVGKNFLISATIESPAINGIPIKVYPNPFTEIAIFEVDFVNPPIYVSQFKLFDVTGRLMRSERFEGNVFNFERKDLAKGLYFFTIENNGKRGSGKLSIH